MTYGNFPRFFADKIGFLPLPLPKNTKEFSSVFFIRISLCKLDTRGVAITTSMFRISLRVFFLPLIFRYVSKRSDQSVFDFRFERSLKISERASWIINRRIWDERGMDKYGKLWVAVSIYLPLPPLIIALKFELIISTMATSVEGVVTVFRFNDQLLPVLSLFNFKPRIFEATAKSKFLNDRAIYKFNRCFQLYYSICAYTRILTGLKHAVTASIFHPRCM